jgi:serine-type D-Ala-D-Ala carboxypeptidase/endopeptidase (penicillin-binding protein 4)
VRRFLLAAVVAAAALLPAAPASAAGLTALQAKLTREMRLAGPTSGALVRDLDSGQTLFSVRPDAPRVPASVEKLFTTTATLMRAGPKGTIPTTVQVADTPVDGVVDGPLYLVGHGDPTLDATGLQTLAARVRAAGVTTVLGGVRGDDSAWDHRIGGPDSAFGYDSDLGGLLTALTVTRGRNAHGIERSPAASAAHGFLRQLELAGVTVEGSYGSGEAPAGAIELTRTESPALGDIVAEMNQPSDNYLAEMLLKNLGASYGAGGTTAAGAAVARAALDDIGVRPRIVDGSGLSRLDRTTPRQVVRLLQRVADQQIGAALTASLPVAGSSGTLETRMRGTAAAGACRAKTGTLRFVSGLAGYCTSRDGGQVAFAFLMNGVDVNAARAIQDRMAAAIARWDGAAAAT